VVILIAQNNHLQTGSYYKYLEIKQIEDETPIFKSNFSIEIECLLKCKQTQNCAAAQVEPIDQWWLCSLFNVVKSLLLGPLLIYTFSKR